MDMAFTPPPSLLSRNYWFKTSAACNKGFWPSAKSWEAFGGNLTRNCSHTTIDLVLGITPEEKCPTPGAWGVRAVGCLTFRVGGWVSE